MSHLHSRLDAPATLFAASLLAASIFAPIAHAQTFTRVVDPAINAVVDQCSAASWVDVDGDGDLDLFVATWGSGTPNLLFLNDGTGVFTRSVGTDLDTSPLECFGSSWADVDNDGRIDLYTSQLFSGGGALYRNTGGGLARESGSALTSTALKGLGTWADFDGDGRVDLAVACLYGTGGITTPSRLFLNWGGFVFSERDTGALAGVLDTQHTATWADFDDDGDPDLFFAAGGVGSIKRDRFYRNMRAETGVAWLQPITTGALALDLHDSQLVSWADFDNDGDLDAYVLDYTSFPNMLYRNDGGGNFTKLTAAGPIVTDLGASHGCAWGDFDNDGDLDVYVARDSSQPNRYYRNNGNGTFTSVTTGDFVTRLSSNWNAVAGDMDGDGDLDLFVPVRDAATPGLLYRNDLASGAHWLEVRCVGTISNRSAIGARVRVHAAIGGAPRWQAREIATGTSYGGQSALDPHFGLAEATFVDSIEIRWPSGIRQVVEGVAANQRITVTEPGGTAVTASVVRARVSGTQVELEWEVADGSGPVTVERGESGVWIDRGSARIDGTGRVRFVDQGVAAGHRYGYRLRTNDGTALTRVGETEVIVPAARAPGLRIGVIEPLGDALRVRVALPEAGEARFDVLDLGGRCRAPSRRMGFAAGEHDVELAAAGELPTGLYWVRLTHGGESRVARAAILK